MAYCVNGCWTVSNRIGVGTESPSHPLHIYDGGNSVYGRWERSTGNMYIGSDSIGGAVGASGNIPLYFWTCDGTERMRLTTAGTLMVGASTNNASADISKIAQLIAPRASTSYPLTLSTAGNGCANDEIRMTFNYGVGFSATAYVGSVLESYGTAATGLVFGGYSGGLIERMRITSAGRVGIGTSTPRFSLDVAGGAMSNFYMSCCAATVDGIGPYDYGIIGSGNGAGALLINDIVGARYSIAAGSYNLTFRKSVKNTVGACVYCNVMTFVGTTDTNCVPNVNIENSLGIGTASPSYRLHVNGTFYAAGSSQDYKQGICKYDTDSCMFMKLKPVTYQYKDEWKHLGKELKSQTQIGLIAEEVAEVAPELAILVKENDNDVVRNVDYEKLSIILLSEVQKLRKEVDDLKHK